MARDSAHGRPVVLVTGAAGDVGSALLEALARSYEVVGFDLKERSGPQPIIAADLSSDDSVARAFATFRERYGGSIASVIHLAAYFDFTGEDNPLYETVNVEGTRRLLRALQDFDVEQLVYSSTILVHRPGEPGLPITEQTAIEPKWAYPQSKARAEEVIRQEHGRIPYVLLRLAGLYDERTVVPTLAAEIQRIYERSPHAYAYAGALDRGQALLHEDDMVDAFVRTVDRRAELPPDTVLLIGEAHAVGYGELQETLGRLVHGEEDWPTASVPKPIAAAGAWLEEKSEPLVPDAFDRGEKPFIRPFMIQMADDHYELDTSRARELLGWTARRDIRKTLPAIVEALKADPAGWYKAHKLTPPDWLETAQQRGKDPEEIRSQAEQESREAHRRFLWAPLFNMALGVWLLASPSALGHASRAMVWSDVLSGALIAVASFLTLSWRLGALRWLVAALGLWVMSAPLLFWAPTAGVYLNGTLVGALVIALAVLVPPTPGASPVAHVTGPTIPPGWDYSPSSWTQRLPIIALALVGLLISRHLAAYQLGHTDGVWEPFFGGDPRDPKNGSEEIVTSSVSRAWPVSDAGLGALTYMLEILTGAIGSSRRWRTSPWLVIVFGVMIVPLGVVSISFIIIQPIVIGTWCTLCLVAAAAMLVQIPYSIDELVATGQFLARRVRAGRPLLRVLLMGDTDEGPDDRGEDELAQPLPKLMRDMLGGGVSLPWTLAASIAIGVWLMFTRLTLGASGAIADADHLIGALAVTIAVTALAETARAVRLLNAALGLALAIAPFVLDASPLHAAADVAAGLALIALSIPRGPIRSRYGGWSRYII